MSEAQLHRQTAAYLAQALPEDCAWTTFPAGGGGRVRGAQLKAAGLRAGWPDVQILWYVGSNRGVFVCLELKTLKGRLSDEQIACHFDIRKAGGYVFVCRSLDEVEGFLRGFGIPLRATAFGRGVIAA